MTDSSSSCVLLADPHHGLAEGVRGLLETTFETVFMVADKASLLEGAERLKPAVVILALSLAGGDLPGLLRRIARCSPASKILVLTMYDEANVAEAVMQAGADAVVLKRSIAADLLLAVDGVLAGHRYVSPAIR